MYITHENMYITHENMYIDSQRALDKDIRFNDIIIDNCISAVNVNHLVEMSMEMSVEIISTGVTYY
jgi:hypothetical protein